MHTHGAEIHRNGEFANALTSTIQSRQCKKIVETGTHRAMGSTRIICDAMPFDAKLITIESNPKLWAEAKRNLLDERVDFRLGLSIPNEYLPTETQLIQLLSNVPKGIEVDAPDDTIAERAEKYAAESRPSPSEDILRKVIVEDYGGKPDLVMLDSAGHLGFIEFQLVIPAIQSSCIIALDDIFHLKHHRSFGVISDDIRFKILKWGNERFGWVIADFVPDGLRGIRG